MPRIKINDISLNYELDIRDLRPSDEAQSNNDKRPVVVFINGLTMDVSGWFLQVRAFSERYKVLRYDCRGQGESGKPDEEYSQEMHADDLKSLMDKLGIQKAHIIGLSNGGMITQHL